MFLKSIFTALGIILLTAFISLKAAEVLNKKPLLSPVLGSSKQQFSENIWTPKLEAVRPGQFSDAPEITALSAIFVEANTGEVLYSKNPNQELPIASLTKIMTTIVALEHKNFDDIFSYKE